MRAREQNWWRSFSSPSVFWCEKNHDLERVYVCVNNIICNRVLLEIWQEEFYHYDWRLLQIIEGVIQKFFLHFQNV